MVGEGELGLVLTDRNEPEWCGNTFPSGPTLRSSPSVHLRSFRSLRVRYTHPLVAHSLTMLAHTRLFPQLKDHFLLDTAYD